MAVNGGVFRPLFSQAAVVTGGTRGIGAAICTELARQGASVVAVARKPADAEQLQLWRSRLRHEGIHGGSVSVMQCDISSAEERAALPGRVAEALTDPVTGRRPWVSILVNNAATNIRKPTIEYSAGEFDTILKTNFLSAFELSQFFHSQLERSGRGAIVNIGSVSGGPARTNTGSVYGSLKSGLNGLTRSLAAEWAPANIRVNCVAPWYIETPLTAGVLSDAGQARPYAICLNRGTS